MKNKDFQRFVPISKIDEELRMVYGFASTPDLDSDGEIITTGALKKALPGYLQFPTLREMHQSKAAGTVKETDLNLDDGLYIGAKVVADDAWELVKEGVYRGFSVGGHVIRKNENIIEELDLVEISLVDVPANKEAKIEVWKRDKLTKDAETVYSLANIMINLKEMIGYHEFLGKDTKKLTKALETIKEVISIEALETEKESEELWDDLFWSDNPDDIKKLQESLSRIEFEKDSVADVLRKVVSIAVSKKLKKNEEELEAEEIEEEVEEAEEDAEELDEAEEGAEEVEEEEEADEEDVEETEEEAIEEADISTLDKLEKLMKKEVKAEKVEMTKELKVVNDALEKVANILTDFGERLERIEKTPAKPKSKAQYVHKVENEIEEVKEKSDLDKKLARLNELSDLLDSLGKSEFAKRGHSQEAGKLQAEIDELMRSA